MLLVTNKRGNNKIFYYKIYYSEDEKYRVFDILKIIGDKHNLTITPKYFSIITFEDLTKKLTEYILSNLEITSDLNLAEILTCVSNFTEIPEEILKSKNQKREVVDARFFYMAFAKRYTRNSLTTIGDLITKDHATVLYGDKQIKNEPGLKKNFIKFEDYMKERGKL